MCNESAMFVIFDGSHKETKSLTSTTKSSMSSALTLFAGAFFAGALPLVAFEVVAAEVAVDLSFAFLDWTPSESLESDSTLRFLAGGGFTLGLGFGVGSASSDSPSEGDDTTRRLLAETDLTAGFGLELELELAIEVRLDLSCQTYMQKAEVKGRREG